MDKWTVTLITLTGEAIDIEIDEDEMEGFQEHIEEAMKRNDFIEINLYEGSCEYLGRSINRLHTSKIIAVS